MLEGLIDAWHNAVNRRGLAGARALVTDPVDVSSPRGTHSITASRRRTPPMTVATSFKIRGGAISAVHRFESLPEALRAAGSCTS